MRQGNPPEEGGKHQEPQANGGRGAPLCVSKTSSVIAWQNHITSARMVALISFLLNVVASLFKSKIRLEAENAALRHQLIVLQRKVRGRVPFTNSDRLFFVQLYRWFPSVLKAVTIIRPETLVRWHRAGFRRYRLRKSRSLPLSLVQGRGRLHAVDNLLAKVSAAG